jgi:hypothetical protein
VILIQGHCGDTRKREKVGSVINQHEFPRVTRYSELRLLMAQRQYYLKVLSIVSVYTLLVLVVASLLLV